MADPVTRRAALVATIVAVPLAIIIGILGFVYFGSRTSTPAASPSAGATVGPDATGSVAMPAPKLSAAHAQACLAFIAQLPSNLRNLPQRHVGDGPEQNAAFGNPPLTVQCGAPSAHPAPTDTIFPISGVCWYEQSGKNATVWTTLDREVPVTVTIPDTYAPGGQAAGQWAAEFSAPLVSQMPSIKTQYQC